MHKEELYDYISSVRRLQDKYKDQIEIRLGMEIEYFEDQLDELKQYKEDMDFLILGQHGSSLYGPEFYDDHSDEDVLLYASLIEKACERGLPDIIAHPDLFMFGKETWTAACEEATHTICASAQKHGVLLEVNLNGLRYGKNSLVKTTGIRIHIADSGKSHVCMMLKLCMGWMHMLRKNMVTGNALIL